MKFIDENGASLGLMDATARGYPRPQGAFAPSGDGDLRPAIYAPEASYADSAASTIAALFPEDLDPVFAERLSARAFSEPPRLIEPGGDIVVADYSAGPSGSTADSEAAFLSGVLAAVARRDGPLLLLADGSGSEGAALAEAVAGLKDLRLVLLYPTGQAAGGIKSQRLAREGGQVLLVGVRGDRAAVDRLIREAAGKRLDGAFAVATGPANPARFAARIILAASTFTLMRKGAAGEIYMGIRAGDGIGFASCLWAWRLGLPLAGIVLSVGEKGVLGIDSAGRHLVERFDADRPGAIRSLSLLQPVDRASALRARADLEAAGGPALDLASAMTLVAAQRSLEAGLRGYANVIVPKGCHPGWDEGAAELPAGLGLRDARVDAEIAPDLDELSKAISQGPRAR
jgi:hypothetical protein